MVIMAMVITCFFSSKDLKPLYPTGLFPTAFFLHKNLLVILLHHLNQFILTLIMTMITTMTTTPRC